jgi:hypothetical protein
MNRMSPRLMFAAFAAMLVTLALAVPAGAAAAEVPLTIEFGGNGEGAVGCEVEGGPLEECEAEYEEGTEVAVVPEPESGSVFGAWEGECDTVVGEVCEVELDGEKTIEAVFELEEFEVTVETEGSGEGVVECQVDGGSYELCEEHETYLYGTELVLFAESEPGSEFVEWGGDCAGIEVECELTVEEQLSAVATFKPEPPFELTIESGGSGEGVFECEVNGGDLEECAEEYEEGDQVTILAEPEPGSEFVEWEGECDSVAGNECEVEMNGDKTVEAVFDLVPLRTLTVTKAGSGSGTVKCEIDSGPEVTCAASYPDGTSVRLKAIAAPGSTFAGFSAGSGSASGCSTSPCAFAIEANSAVTATFNVESGGGGGGGGGGSTGGGGGSTGTPAPPAPPAAGTATAAGTASVKAGKAALKLSCSGGPCQGSLTLTAKVKQGKKSKNLTIGKASFSLAAGTSATLNIKLSGPAKQELAKGKTIKAKLSGTGIAARTVKLVPAKKK